MWLWCLTEVMIKAQCVWDITPCQLVNSNRRLGATCFLLPPFVWYKKSKTQALKSMAPRAYETSVTIYQLAWRNIPEVLNFSMKLLKLSINKQLSVEHNCLFNIYVLFTKNEIFMVDRTFLLIFIFCLLINIINCLLFINKLNNICARLKIIC